MKKWNIENLEALRVQYDGSESFGAYQAYINGLEFELAKALEQEERTQRTMHCGTADAFIAMDDEHKRRWFVQSLRESQRRKELEDMLEQPAQEPVASTWIHEGVEYPTMVEVMPVYDYQTSKPTDDNNDYINAWLPPYTKLYTHPAPSWQGLNDDEMMEIWCSDEVESTLDFGRAIEQALKEKNGS